MHFSKLTDDQLLQLIQGALAEAVSRGVTVAKAAKDAYVDAQEAARIKAEAFEKAAAELKERERCRLEKQARCEAEAVIAASQQQTEAAKTKALWEKKKAIFIALEEWGLEEDWQINLWSRGADNRVYVDGGGDRQWAWKICLYVTGNSYNAPESFTVEGKNQFTLTHPLKNDRKEDWEKLKQFLLLVSKHWKTLKISRSELLNYSGDINEKHLAAYRKALGIKEQSHV